MRKIDKAALELPRKIAVIRLTPCSKAAAIGLRLQDLQVHAANPALWT